MEGETIRKHTTVAQLIEKLKQYDPNAAVLLPTEFRDGSYQFDHMDIEISEKYYINKSRSQVLTFNERGIRETLEDELDQYGDALREGVQFVKQNRKCITLS